jgi:hypothetical protein
MDLELAHVKTLCIENSDLFLYGRIKGKDHGVDILIGKAKLLESFLSRKQCFAFEPNLNSKVVGASLGTSSYIVDPVALTASLPTLSPMKVTCS